MHTDLEGGLDILTHKQAHTRTHTLTHAHTRLGEGLDLHHARVVQVNIDESIGLYQTLDGLSLRANDLVHQHANIQMHMRMRLEVLSGV